MGEVGCISDEIQDLVGPAERRAMEGAAGWASQGWRDVRARR
jgi:hypothetical protein